MTATYTWEQSTSSEGKPGKRNSSLTVAESCAGWHDGNELLRVNALLAKGDAPDIHLHG